MSDRTFPALPEGLDLKFQAIAKLMEFDRGYLDDPRCPYSEKAKNYLRQMLGSGDARRGRPDTLDGQDIDTFKEGQGSSEQVDSLIVDVQKAINQIRRLQAEMELPEVDLSDKITFLKNFGSLVERWLSLKEKAHGLKHLYEFQRIVIQVMDEVLDKDQRLDFKNRLKKVGLLEEGEEKEAA